MSRERAIDFLESYRELLSTEPDHPYSQHQTNYNNPAGDVITKLSELLHPLMGLSESEMLVTPVNSHTIDKSQVAFVSLGRLQSAAEPTEIVDDIIDLFSNRVGSTCVVVGVSGIHVRQKVDISKRVSIVPAQDVPESYWRDDLFRMSYSTSPLHMVFDAEGVERLPKAALLIRDQDVRLIQKYPTTWSTESSQNGLDKTIDKAIAALTLIDSCAPFKRFIYGAAEHAAIPGGSFSGGSFSQLSIPSFVFPKLIDSTNLSELYDSLDRLEDKNWDIIKLSVERLAQSRAQKSQVDRAIDLGISIESLLLHNESGIGAKGELRYKVGLRGSWLLSSEATQRIRLFDRLQRAYDTRSAAVHTGNLSQKYRENLDDADQLCADMLNFIITKGRFPDWKKLVLGAGHEAWA